MNIKRAINVNKHILSTFLFVIIPVAIFVLLIGLFCPPLAIMFLSYLGYRDWDLLKKSRNFIYYDEKGFTFKLAMTLSAFVPAYLALLNRFLFENADQLYSFWTAGALCVLTFALYQKEHFDNMETSSYIKAFAIGVVLLPVAWLSISYVFIPEAQTPAMSIVFVGVIFVLPGLLYFFITTRLDDNFDSPFWIIVPVCISILFFAIYQNVDHVLSEQILIGFYLLAILVVTRDVIILIYQATKQIINVAVNDSCQNCGAILDISYGHTERIVRYESHAYTHVDEIQHYNRVCPRCK